MKLKIWEPIGQLIGGPEEGQWHVGTTFLGVGRQGQKAGFSGRNRGKWMPVKDERAVEGVVPCDYAIGKRQIKFTALFATADEGGASKLLNHQNTGLAPRAQPP
jgi:hypothetical protein